VFTLTFCPIFCASLPWCDTVWCCSVTPMFGIGALAQLARQHEREHARDVGLIGHREQVVHQVHVILERVGHARPAYRA
jgi:hypothetical protein